MFLYRRAPDEEIYFATASATLGRPYDRAAFGARGESALPTVDVPADLRDPLISRGKSRNLRTDESIDFRFVEGA